jgi:hypothetical protein
LLRDQLAAIERRSYGSLRQTVASSQSLLKLHSTTKTRCESAEALFDQAEDEEAVIRRLGAGHNAELPVVVTGIFHSDPQANYGPFGELNHLLLIKSWEIRPPPPQAGNRSKP